MVRCAAIRWACSRRVLAWALWVIPCVVANGEFDLGITTPTASAWLAMKGTGPFKTPHGNLRAIANYPHRDCVLFALSKATGISSLDELVERRYPLRLATGRKSNDQLDLVSFVVDEVLKQYGGSLRCSRIGADK